MVKPRMLLPLLLTMMVHWPNSRVEGRGRLVDPPARSSLWRFGYDTPINYDDNGLNCGGRVMLWTVNQGQCGVCGDTYNGPRDNERGGKYVTDMVVRSYNQAQVITVKVDVTANERGWFEFNLCNQSDPLKPSTEDCMKDNLLELAGGGTRYLLPASVNGDVSIDVKLPNRVVCSRCVFRWKWNAGNTWGVAPDGRSCLGCGQQEQFYGCADVAILPSSRPSQPGSARPRTNPPPTTRTTATTTTTAATPKTTTAVPTMTSSTPKTTIISPQKTSTSSSTTETMTTNGQSTKALQTASPQKICKGINEWSGKDELDQWCQVNCVVLNICPASFCGCVSQ